MKEDKRAQTSKENGRKGGRPALNTFMVNIDKVDIEAAIKKDDLAEAIEKGFRKRFPNLKVYVQTTKRLERAGVNYDPYTGTNNLVMLNNCPIKFPWELRYFMGDFVTLTKGKKDFCFQIRIPKEIRDVIK